MTFEEIIQAFTHNTPVVVVTPWGPRQVPIILTSIPFALQADEIEIIPVTSQDYEDLCEFFQHEPEIDYPQQKVHPIVVRQSKFKYIHAKE